MEKTLGNTDVNGAHKYDLLKGATPIAQGAKMPWQLEVMGKYEVLGKAIGALVDVKNSQYGDAFHQTGRILAILYPEGVTPEQYDDMLAVVRILDKLFRIANGKQGNEDPWQDIAGYGLLGMEG